MCVFALEGDPKNLARPKSPILRTPLRLTSRLLGFRSRCRTQLSWRYSSPSSVCSVYAFMLAGVSTSEVSLMMTSRSVSIKSMTRETLDLWPKTSLRPMTFGCDSSWKKKKPAEGMRSP